MSIYQYDYDNKFSLLELKLRPFEGSSSAIICENLIQDITSILKFGRPHQNIARKNITLTSPASLMIVQEFIASYGMHLERISSEYLCERIFKIVPNW